MNQEYARSETRSISKRRYDIIVEDIVKNVGSVFNESTYTHIHTGHNYMIKVTIWRTCRCSLRYILGSFLRCAKIKVFSFY